MDDFLVFTSVRVVCRECLSFRDLPNVVLHIDKFLGVGSVWGACRLGSVRLLSYIAARNTEVNWGELLSSAIIDGHVHILQWLLDFHADRCEWSASDMDRAAVYGQLSVVQWLHANRSEGCTKEAMYAAARRGHFEMVKWLHHNRSEGCRMKAIEWAMRWGKSKVAKWLRDNRTEGCKAGCMKCTIDNAAKSGHLEFVKWLHENRTEVCTTDAMDMAAFKGHLDVVKWLHENRTEGCTTDAMDLACSTGHLEVIKWLHKNRSEGCSVRANVYAAAGGHLEVIQWLHANGYKERFPLMFYKTLKAATGFGHLPIIKLLLSSIDNNKERLEYAQEALSIAKERNHQQVIDWLEPQVEPNLPTKRQRLA